MAVAEAVAAVAVAEAGAGAVAVAEAVARAGAVAFEEVSHDVPFVKDLPLNCATGEGIHQGGRLT